MTSVLADEDTFGHSAAGPLLTIPCTFERAVLPGGIIATQMVCDPSYLGGMTPMEAITTNFKIASRGICC